MKQRHEHCTDHDLQTLLQSEKRDAADSPTLRHLAACPVCQTRLDGIAGSNAEWREAREALLVTPESLPGEVLQAATTGMIAVLITAVRLGPLTTVQDEHSAPIASSAEDSDQDGQTPPAATQPKPTPPDAEWNSTAEQISELQLSLSRFETRASSF